MLDLALPVVTWPAALSVRAFVSCLGMDFPLVTQLAVWIRFEDDPQVPCLLVHHTPTTIKNERIRQGTGQQLPSMKHMALTPVWSKHISPVPGLRPLASHHHIQHRVLLFTSEKCTFCLDLIIISCSSPSEWDVFTSHFKTVAQKPCKNGCQQSVKCHYCGGSIAR